MDRFLNGGETSVPRNHDLLREIVADFEAVSAKLQCVIELLAEDDSGTVDLAALHRAKHAAECGAITSREATCFVRRAFDR